MSFFLSAVNVSECGAQKYFFHKWVSWRGGARRGAGRGAPRRTGRGEADGGRPRRHAESMPRQHGYDLDRIPHRENRSIIL